MKHLRRHLLNGGHALGTWSMLSSANVIDVLGTTALDFVVIDMEHGSLSFETAEHQIRAAEARGIGGIIRTCDSHDATILRALETNCAGIMIPHIETPDDALRVAGHCRYCPQGTRGLSPYTRTHAFTHEDLSSSLKKANDALFTGILVEGANGLSSIDDIAAVDGIDMIYLGMYDISQALGKPGELDHPDVIKETTRCVKVINANKKVAGSFARDVSTCALYRKLGVQFIALVADSYALRSFYDDALRKLNTSK